MTEPYRKDLELDFLRQEVARLETLVDQLARIRPRAVWGGDLTDLTPMDRFSVRYRVELRVPDEQVLTSTAGLDAAIWQTPFGRQALDHLASRVHRAMGMKLDERAEVRS